MSIKGLLFGAFCGFMFGAVFIKWGIMFALPIFAIFGSELSQGGMNDMMMPVIFLFTIGGAVFGARELGDDKPPL